MVRALPVPVRQLELLKEKEINRAQLFEILKQARIISRSSLAEQTRLSRATIATIADELVQAGIAREVGLAKSTGGRPSMLLEFNPDVACTLGAVMNDRQWSVVLTNFDGRVLDRQATHVVDDSPQAVVKALKEAAALIFARSKGLRILPAIGVGTPGLVDTNTGVVQSDVLAGWGDIPLRAMIEESLGLKAFIANRSKVGALAELWYGPEREIKNLIYVAIGTGVAAGIVYQGELFIGSNSSAGELGHMTILPDGPLCPCGNQGCLQQLVSGPAIANLARQRLRQDANSLLTALAPNRIEQITAHMVFEAAARGDSLALEIVTQVASYLGIAIANMINVLNPQKVVLGGPVGQAAEVMLAPLRAEVRRRAMSYPLSIATIDTSTLGPDAGALGAAVLVLQHSYELLFSRA